MTCQVLNRTLPVSRLSLEWLVWRAGESERRTLARLSTEAITLPPPEEEDRGNPDLPSCLFLSQLTPGLYTLTLHTAEEQDSGAYSCRVQEWLQDLGHQWYKRAEDRSAATYVSVRQTGGFTWWTARRRDHYMGRRGRSIGVKRLKNSFTYRTRLTGNIVAEINCCQNILPLITASSW